MEILILVVILLGLWPVWLVLAIVLLIRNYRKKQALALSAGAQSQVQDTVGPTHADLVRQLEQLVRYYSTAGQSERAAGVAGAIEVLNKFYAGAADNAAPAVTSVPVSPGAQQAESAQAASVPLVVPAAVPVPPAPYASVSPALSEEQQKLNNSLTLLYLGGFLFVAAIALFVLFSDTSGGFKTTLVIITSAVLYLGGLYIDTYSKKFRPAAITFVAMGIGAVPFLGQAAYQYLSVDGSVTWFFLSLVAMAMAGLAAYRLPAQLFSYLLSFTWLSVAVSATFNLGVEAHVLMWAAVASGLVLSLAAYYLRPLRKFQKAFDSTALIVAVVSIYGTAAASIEAAAWWRTGVTVLLAAAVFAVQALYSDIQRTRSYYGIAAHSTLILAALLIVGDFLDSFEAGGYVLAVFVLVQFLILVLTRDERQSQSTIFTGWLYGLTAWLPFFALLFWLGERDNVVWGLTATAVLVSVLALQRRTAGMSWAVITAMLLLPATVGWYGLDDAWPAIVISLLYTVAAVAAFAIRYNTAAVLELRETWRAGYILLIITAFMWSLFAGQAVDLGVMSLVVGIAVIGISYCEKQAWLLGLAPLLAVLGINRLLYGTSADGAEGAFVPSVTVAAIGYALSYIISKPEDAYRRSLVVSTIGLALFGVFAGSAAREVPGLLPPLILLMISGAIMAESRRFLPGLGGQLAGLGLAVFSLQWMISVSFDDVNWLVYTHMWAIYAAACAAYLRQAGQPRESYRLFGYAALVVLSGPVALEAMGSPESYYSLLLLAEHVALAVIGVMTQRPLLVKWGAAVTALSLIYMLRDYTYFNLGLIAVLLIGYAVYRIGRNTHTDDAA